MFLAIDVPSQEDSQVQFSITVELARRPDCSPAVSQRSSTPIKNPSASNSNPPVTSTYGCIHGGDSSAGSAFLFSPVGSRRCAGITWLLRGGAARGADMRGPG